MSSSSSNLGIAFRCLGDPVAILDSARRAERAGFSNIWLVEVEADTLALAASIAQVTERIRIGTGVVNCYLRFPTSLAMSALTVAQLSRGRFILGIGAGAPESYFATQIRSDTPLTRLKETVQIVRQALTMSEVKFAGRLFRTESFRLSLPNTHRIPIFVAALGFRTLELAAEMADGVLLMLPTLDYVRLAVNKIQAVLRKRGASPSRFDIGCHFVTVVSNDGVESTKLAKRVVATYSSFSAYNRHFKRMGFEEELRTIEQALQTGGIDAAARVVPDQMANSLIIHGTARECLEQISEYVKAGITYPTIYPSTPSAVDFPTVLNKTIETFAPRMSGIV